MMRLIHCVFVSLIVAGLTVAFAGKSLAVPYASGVRNTGGNTWEFVLNEAADAVTVLRDGGNAVNLGAIGAGRHQFDMSGFNAFDIQVQNSAPAAWTSISDPASQYTNFTGPTGLAINTDASSPFFGTVYVANSSAAATTLGRNMALGIYPLTADLVGVDLTTFAAVTDAQDTSQAKTPAGWGTLSNNFVSPYRMTLDAGDNLIVGDWSDPTGGLKYASPDLTSGGHVLGGVDIDGNPPTDTGPPGGVFSQESDEFGRIPLHGSIKGKPYVTGTVGVDLTVWALDEDLDVDLAVPNNDGGSLWRWDVGSATNFDAMAPELVISAPNIGKGFLAIPAVTEGSFYDSQSDKWYLTQYRFNGDGNQSGLVIIDADGPGPDVLNPTAPNVVWASIDFTRDPNGDGDTSDGIDGFANFGGVAGANGEDVFRLSGNVATSPDGTKLILHRIGDFNDNPVLQDRGVVLVIPLDENGLPDIEIDDSGTPADPADDKFANVEQITISGNNGTHTRGHVVEFDAAGNLYVTNSTSAAGGQLMQVFSPGGDTLATTTSTGMFTVEPFVPGNVLGDYNGNGTVDAADYVLWRKGGPLLNEGDNPGTVDQGDYDFWRSRFGATSGSGSALAGAAVPEPGTLALALVGFMFCALRRGKNLT